MKEKGMLFSTDMVQAIIAGRKTCTRRIFSDYQLKLFGYAAECGECSRFIDEGVLCENDLSYILDLSPYHVGDKIYVRETWSTSWGEPKDTDCVGEYLADYSPNDIVTKTYFKWHPAIHMPKKYARIWLEVTGVNVQQVKNITEEEAMREGFVKKESGSARGQFLGYMTSRYGDTDRDASELLNKWCFVIEFKVVKK